MNEQTPIGIIKGPPLLTMSVNRRGPTNGCVIAVVYEIGLGELEVPVAILIPHELIISLRRVVETILLDRVTYLLGDGLQQGHDPPLRQTELDLV